MKNISVIGMGYIGLPTALLLANSKNKIYCIDNDFNKINSLKKGNIHLKEKSIQDLFRKKNKYIEFKNNIENSDIYIICVPTPVKKISTSSYKKDLSILNSVLNKIGKIIKKDDLVIIESTCPPSTAYRFYKKIIKKVSFYLSTCPERAIPGSTIKEMINNYRVIGASCNKAFRKTKSLYKSFVRGKIYQTNLVEAELIKLFENSYRDTNIALANEMDSICKKFGVVSKKVISLSNFHPRVNIHKPGIGVGGHCLPVDPWFLINKLNKKCSVIYNSRIVNTNKQNEIFLELLKILDKKKKILFFGTTYKENTDDIRNSPSINIIKKLLIKMPKASIFDPLNRSYNNISNKDIFKIKFDIVVIFVKHKWLKNNKIKFLKKITL